MLYYSTSLALRHLGIDGNVAVLQYVLKVVAEGYNNVLWYYIVIVVILMSQTTVMSITRSITT